MRPNWTDFTLTSFSSSQRLATTYYFYWHDLTDPQRLARFQARFHVPVDPAHYSFLLPETHTREFRDMADIGLDFVLPVYWGEPGHPGRTTGPTARVQRRRFLSNLVGVLIALLMLPFLIFSCRGGKNGGFGGGML